MRESGVNSDLMVKVGMVKARAVREPWLPSPGQFCEWCKPSAQDLGLPSIEQAFNEARIELSKHSGYRKWSHPAVYFAAASVGIFELKSLGDKSGQYKEIRSRFAAAYNEEIERVKSGETVEIPEENRIEDRPGPTDTPRVKAAGSTALANIMGMYDE